MRHRPNRPYQAGSLLRPFSSPAPKRRIDVGTEWTGTTESVRKVRYHGPCAFQERTCCRDMIGQLGPCIVGHPGIGNRRHLILVLSRGNIYLFSSWELLITRITIASRGILTIPNSFTTKLIRLIQNLKCVLLFACLLYSHNHTRKTLIPFELIISNLVACTVSKA